MVNGRSINGRLWVGLPKREIRRPIGLGRLETEWELMPTGSGLFSVGLHRRWRDQNPIYVMTSGPNEGPMPTDCPDIVYEVTRARSLRLRFVLILLLVTYRFSLATTVFSNNRQ